MYWLVYQRTRFRQFFAPRLSWVSRNGIAHPEPIRQGGYLAIIAVPRNHPKVSVPPGLTAGFYEILDTARVLLDVRPLQRLKPLCQVIQFLLSFCHRVQDKTGMAAIGDCSGQAHQLLLKLSLSTLQDIYVID